MSYLDAAAKIISDFEGEKLLAYKCPAGIWTIGFGHTGPDVNPTMRITSSDAVRLLYDDMLEADKAIDELVEVPLRENPRAALISFIFNVGRNAFRTSTLLKLINAGNFPAASSQFARWNKAGGVVLPGLVKRRHHEKILFES